MTADSTVFVVDDDEAMRNSLRWLIESVGLKTETFASAQEFLQAWSPDRPGCLVVDVRMPGMSGLELQEKLRERDIRVPVIVLTGHGDVPMAVRAMKAGVVDFLEKPCNDQMLLDCIQHALEKDSGQRATSELQARIRARMEDLTPRERVVMDMIVRGGANKDVAQELGVSIRTIEVHRAKVMEKMGAESLAELVRMSIAVGVIEG